MKHTFGGQWTQIKLEMLGRYLNFFNKALQNQPTETNRFKRIYIDAFAGTGECDIKLSDEHIQTIDGSAKLAISASPSFDEIHLIDLNPLHVAELRKLKSPTNTVLKIYENDANVALVEIIDRIDWRKSRGVLFLDPYGMSVNWETLQKIASTKALDVWYLFPLSAVYRQAANDLEMVDEDKAAKLDSVLGTTEWREEFYETSTQESLFGGDKKVTRTADYRKISTYVWTRLSTVFTGWVSAPIILPDTGPPMFALFFAVSNPSNAAVTLSKRAAEYLFEMLKKQKIGKKQCVEVESTQVDLF